MKPSQYRNRKGGAVVEAALCLPLILMIVSGTIELTTMIYLKESLTIAAFEGARVAVTSTGNDAAVRERIRQVLEERHIDMTGYPLESAVVVTPAAEAAEMMEPIRIDVTGPTRVNTVSPFGFMRYISPPDMSTYVVMRKEFTGRE